MANKWTEEQRAVIDHRNSNLLVAAAAGSGKTAVLIERIIRLILDPINPVDIDRLLVVTFTKAAAREMRERIGLAIEKEISNDPENTRLQRQRMLLNKADITTIDSFCNKVMRTNFHAIDLDPSIKIGDEIEIEILRNETIEEFFEKKYQEEDEKFLLLVDAYSTKTNDNNLIELILKINNFVNSAPYPNMWLDDAAEKFNTEKVDISYYIESIIGSQLEEAYIELSSMVNQLKELTKDLANFGGYEKHYDFMDDFRQKLEIFTQKIGVFMGSKKTTSIKEYEKVGLNKELGQIIDMVSSNYVTNKGNAPRLIKNEFEEDYKAIKAKYDIIKKAATTIISGLRLDPQMLEKENKLVYPYMRALSDMVIEFRAYYMEKKLGKSIVEFSDVEHFALDILTDISEEGSIVPSDIARSYQDRYQEVFTDEYQDSNMVQETILDMVARKEIPNRFMVGDVKQSIYMFRQAMPEIFIAKYKTYSLYKGDDTGDKKILLYKNFRSRKEVLEACNHVFKEIMTSKTGDIDYTDEERLNPGAEFEENKLENSHVGGPVEVYLVDTNDIEGVQYEDYTTELDNSNAGMELYANRQGLSDDEIEEIKDMEKFRIEAMQIANIIDDMVSPSPQKPKYMVYDKEIGDYRCVSYKDIVVLFRSTKNRAQILEEVLLKRDIPAYSESGGGYFSTIEVSTIVNLLKVIDNPMQDIALIATMRSPIFGYTDQELAKIRLVDKKASYYQAIRLFMETSSDEQLLDKLGVFLDKLDYYRKEAFLLPIDQFIWKLYRDTGYYKYLENISMGEKRQANLILLHEKAKNYEAGSYRGLFSFLHYIERLNLTSKEPKEASLLLEDADLVRIMTIHKSKGLEFPVVIIANSDKGFNLRGDTNVLDLDYNLGYGPKYIDVDKKVSYRTTAMATMKKSKIRAVKSEEMRMLYVAMTRAKEKLIFTASIKDYNKMLDTWKDVPRDLDGNIEPASILAAKSYLEWIMPTIVSLEKRQECLDVRGDLRKYQGYKDCRWIVQKSNKYEVSKEYMQKLKALEDEGDIKSVPDLIGNRDENKRKLEKRMIDEIDAFDYRYKSSAYKPSSISVTDIKKIVAREKNEAVHDKLYKNTAINDLKSPLFIHTGKPNSEEGARHEYKSNERGTIFHLVMQLLDFKAFENMVGYQQLSFEGMELPSESDKEIRREVVRQIDKIVENNILLREEADTVNVSWIVTFIKSSIYNEILDADKRQSLYKETAINYNIKMKDIYKDQDIDGDESMMMVGIIDLFYENTQGDIVLLDYKTDYVANRSYEEIIDRYKIQLDLYKRAIEDISGKKVVKKYLYMFSVGKLLEC